MTDFEKTTYEQDGRAGYRGFGAVGERERDIVDRYIFEHFDDLHADLREAAGGSKEAFFENKLKRCELTGTYPLWVMLNIDTEKEN